MACPYLGLDLMSHIEGLSDMMRRRWFRRCFLALPVDNDLANDDYGTSEVILANVGIVAT
jgi:hypothetical protein